MSAYIYAITGPKDGLIKIGFSICPDARAKVLSPDRTYRVGYSQKVPDYLTPRTVEHYAHYVLAKHHAHGEYFRVTIPQAKRGIQAAIRHAKKTISFYKETSKAAWLPIKAAPKGETVLLAGQWNDPDSPSYNEWTQATAFYGSPLSNPNDHSLDGWYFGMTNLNEWAVTWQYWMPLPDDPKPKGRKK